jgi:hypothetical protein
MPTAKHKSSPQRPDFPVEPAQKQQIPQMQMPSVNVEDDMEGITTDEALAKVSMILASTKNPKTLTELDDREIKLCAQLYAVANKTRNRMLTIFLWNFLNLRVSYNRKGRSELVDIARSGQMREEQKTGRLRNFLFGSH